MRSGDPYRLVVLDALMPEIDGFELAEEIHQRAGIRGKTVLMTPSLTLRADAADRERAGIDGCLLKPILESELRQTVLSVFGHAPARELLPEPQQKRRPRRGSRPMHVLLAEDSALSQKLLLRILAGEGHTAVTAANGRAALAAFEREPFDLILMDLQMPELGGLETTMEIRRREASTGRHTPIVALTASVLEGDRERCLEAGMDAYVAKPLEPEVLLDLMARLSEPRWVRARQESGSFPMRRDARVGEPRELARRDPIGSDPLRLPSTASATPKVFSRDLTLARCAHNPEFAREIVDLFFETAGELVTGLHGAVEAGNAEEVHRLAHRLKGAATNVSGVRVEEVAGRLSLVAREGRLDEAGEILNQLDLEFAHLERALVEFRIELLARHGVPGSLSPS